MKQTGPCPQGVHDLEGEEDINSIISPTLTPVLERDMQESWGIREGFLEGWVSAEISRHNEVIN